MKNKIIILALIFIGITASAYGQNIQALTLYGQTAAGVIKAKDTLINTDTSYLVLQNGYTGTTGGPITQFGDVIYEWSAIPSITGTTNSGTTITAEGSMTGTFAYTGDWVPLIGDYTQYSGAASWSISGSSTITKYFILPKCQFKYVRFKIVSAGTQTMVVTGSAWLRKHG